jgi:WD40 repeat protein
MDIGRSCSRTESLQLSKVRKHFMKSVSPKSNNTLLIILIMVVGISHSILALAQPTQDAVIVLSSTRDGNRYVTGHYDRSIRIWDAATHLLISTIPDDQTGAPSEYKINDIAFSPDNSQIAVTYGDALTIGGTLRVINILEQQAVANFPAGTFAGDVSWQPNGSLIAYKTLEGSFETSVVYTNIWDFATSTTVARIEEGFNDTVAGVEWNWSANFGLRLATISGNGVRIRNYNNLEDIITLSTNEQLLDIAWSFDNSQIAAVSDTGRVIIWNTNTEQVVAEFASRSSLPALERVEWFSENQIATSYRDTIAIWNITTLEMDAEINAPNISDFVVTSSGDILYNSRTVSLPLLVDMSTILASSTPTSTPTGTPAPIATETATNTPTPADATATASTTHTDTPAPTATETATPTPTPADMTATASATATDMPSATATETHTPTPVEATATASATPTDVPTPTATSTQTPTPTELTATASATPTDMPSSTATETPLPTATATPTDTPVLPSATPLPSPTPTLTPSGVTSWQRIEAESFVEAAPGVFTANTYDPQGGGGEVRDFDAGRWLRFDNVNLGAGVTRWRLRADSPNSGGLSLRVGSEGAAPFCTLAWAGGSVYNAQTTTCTGSASGTVSLYLRNDSVQWINTNWFELEIGGVWYRIETEWFNAAAPGAYEAPTYDGQGGALEVRDFAPGGWLRFDNVNLSPSPLGEGLGVRVFRLRADSPHSGTLSLRAGSPTATPFCTLTWTGTSVYTTQEAACSVPASGVQTVYLTNDSVAWINVNWFAVERAG